MESPDNHLLTFTHEKMNAGLYIGATPIGNLGDISLRMLQALKSANEIWAEDTRNIRKLMGLYGIDLGERRILACHDHNEKELSAKCVAMVEAGTSILYVSDAGMPLISDPGFKLVHAIKEAGLYVTVLPGASSTLTALALSAAPTDSFAFYGFAPSKQASLERFYNDIKSKSMTAIVFESPKRLLSSLEMIAKVYGTAHNVCVARELTKKFEEAPSRSVSEHIEHYTQNPAKGEIVLTIWPFEIGEIDEDEVRELLASALSTQKTNAAVKEVANATGWPRNRVYELALSLREK